MKFEWDENKRRDNIRKHGIDCIDAAAIFEEDVVLILDDRYDYGEARYIAFGLSRGKAIKVIVVAYTERGDNIRIISARKALNHEESFYFEQITD